MGRAVISSSYSTFFSIIHIPQFVVCCMQVPSFSIPIWKHWLSFFLFFHFFVVLLGFLNRCFLQTGSFLLILEERIHVHIILTFAMLVLVSRLHFSLSFFHFIINGVTSGTMSAVEATTSTVILLLDQLLG